MIANTLKTYAEHFEETVSPLWQTEPTEYSVLYDACQYSLLLGGKRIRPFLVNAFYKLCGGKDDASLNFELAIECIHTYSLIHDDLPFMDDDDMRRGKPACHIQFGNANALLAGDALLTKAFSFAAQTKGVKPENVLEAITVLSECSGIDGMIGGQVIDLLYEDKVADEFILEKICSLKTGALIKAACLIGTILADASPEQREAAESFAKNLGLAFQITDDILDVVGNEEKLGKPVGSDQNNDKSTFVSVFGIEKAKRLAEELTQRAKDSLDIFGESALPLKELADFLCSRDY